VRHDLLTPADKTGRRCAVGAPRICGDRVLSEIRDERLDRTAVNRDELVPTPGAREHQRAEGLDEHFPVVDVNGHRERRAERRRERDEVVRIVQRRDVLNERFLEIQVVGVMDPVKPICPGGPAARRSVEDSISYGSAWR
jgi:hypothetical protein